MSGGLIASHVTTEKAPGKQTPNQRESLNIQRKHPGECTEQRYSVRPKKQKRSDDRGVLIPLENGRHEKRFGAHRLAILPLARG